MPRTRKLTAGMVERLAGIAAYQPTTGWPQAGYWHSSSTDRALLARGLIERTDYTTRLAGGMTMKVNACRATEAGFKALAEHA